MLNFKRSVQTRILAVMLAIVLIMTPTVGGSIAGLMVQTQSIINTFLSGLTPDGDLIIRKEVSHPFGEGYLIPEGLKFEFAVCLGSDYAKELVETSQGHIEADETGTIIVMLGPGEAVRLSKIREDTVVTVTETACPGFTPAGGLTQTVTIGSEDSMIRYKNVYAPDPADPSGIFVTGLKILEGRDWQEGDQFTFTLEYRQTAGEDTWKTLGTDTVTYDPDDPEFDHFDFTDLIRAMEFETAGTYAFRISEVCGDIGGIVYDQVVSYFDILVGDDDMNGSLEIQDVAGYQNAEACYDPAENTFQVKVTISNRYAPEGTAEVIIPIRKMVQSMSGEDQSRAGYTFELYDEYGLLVDVSEETSAAGEIAMKICFDAVDAGAVYHYTLVETEAGESWNGVTYDSRVWPIEVMVTDNLDGTISAVINDQPEAYEFVNIYDPEDAQTDFGGFKELTGRELREGEFFFALYTADSSFQVMEDSKPLQSVSNAVDGSFAFDAISYERVGTYYYVVSEQNLNMVEGVTYDTTVYHVIVTVTDDGGILRADTLITDSLGTEAVIIFRNVYKPGPVSVNLEGKKILYGQELAAGQFRFLLFQADEAWQSRNQPLMSATNNSGGTIIFDALTFTEPGTFFYVVKEDTSEQVEGMDYDAREYGVQITVWDDGEGSLQADLLLTLIGGSEVEHILFENTYTKPMEPSEPSDPTDPTEPSEPSEPTDPTEPSEPSEPTEPTDPTVPTEPTVPPDTGDPGGGHEPGRPDHPVDPDDPDQPENPETGDNSPVELYILLLVLSGTGIIMLVLEEYQNKRKR